VKCYKLLKPLPAEAVLREKVGRILLAENFAKIDSSSAYRLLDPQRVGVEVPQLA